MNREANSAKPNRILVGACPGGTGRHYRVQQWDSTWGGWACYGTFRQRIEAQRCVRRLVEAGQMARVVDYSRCAVAS